jgi:hypothetical protein
LQDSAETTAPVGKAKMQNKDETLGGMDMDRHFRLRKQILSLLYEAFRQLPHASMELPSIEQACETSSQDLNWNIVYLEKCGYVELSKSTDAFPYVANSVSLTAMGIDLVENQEKFHRKFPIKEDR